MEVSNEVSNGVLTHTIKYKIDYIRIEEIIDYLKTYNIIKFEDNFSKSGFSYKDCETLEHLKVLIRSASYISTGTNFKLNRFYGYEDILTELKRLNSLDIILNK